MKRKHDMRRAFHPQLRLLWEQPPLSKMRQRLDLVTQSNNVRHVDIHQFVPLVTESLSLLAELDIVFLRPEAPGSLITQGGDIDN